VAKIIRVVHPVHMGLGHHGLKLMLKKLVKIDVTKLGVGEFVMCLNKKKDKLKMIGGGGHVIGYLNTGRKIMLESVQYIPDCFGANGIDYDEAVRKALNERLGK